MISSHKTRIVICASLLALGLRSSPAHAISNEALATGICISATGYLIGLSYSEWVYKKAVEQFNFARAIIHTHASQAVQLKELKQEALRAHNNYCNAYYITTPTYKNYPLLWYKLELDKALSRLKKAAWFMFWSEDAHKFVNDLRTLQELLIIDYDFIKERRLFEQSRELLEQTRNLCLCDGK